MSENLVACGKIAELDEHRCHRSVSFIGPIGDPARRDGSGLDRLLEQGKVKAVGVSNYTIHQFETLDQLMDERSSTK